MLHHLGDLRADVDAHLVEERHRADREAERGHGRVERLDRDALVEHPRRLVHVRGEGAARVEPGAVADDDDVLAEAAAELHRRGESRGAGLGGDHDLEERHLVHGREEVHPEHLLRPPAPVRDVADRDRRRVRREHALLAGRPLRLREDTALEVQVLEHRLDHEVGAPEAAVVERRRDPVEALLQVEARQAPSLEALLPGAARVLHPAAERLGGRVLEAHRHAGLGGRRGDAGAHEPGPEDAELGDVDRRRALGVASVLLDLLGREEHGHEVLRHVAGGEPAERLGLELEALGQCRGGPLLHDLDRLERRRVVAARLLQHRRARLAEDDRPQQPLL